jgi:hypothetical protein
VAHNSLNTQAQKILKTSDKKFPPPTVRDNICIQVMEIDRGHTDPRTVLTVVLSVDNDFCKLGTKFGMLKQLYARIEFTILKEKFINLKSVLDNEISLISASLSQSLTGGQGFSRCFCTRKCSTS